MEQSSLTVTSCFSSGLHFNRFTLAECPMPLAIIFRLLISNTITSPLSEPLARYLPLGDISKLVN